MNLQRLRRLIQIIGLLHAGDRNTHSMARECGVTRRTIFRDLHTLREVGIPLEFDEASGGFTVPAEFFAPPAKLTPEETVAILTLCHELAGARNSAGFETARRAATKLLNSLPANLREQFEGMGPAVHIASRGVGGIVERDDLFPSLLESMQQRRAVQLELDGAPGEETDGTRFNPYRLLFRHGGWYALGYSSRHDTVESIPLARIAKIEVLEETYTIPRNFNLERYLRNAWSAAAAPGPDTCVVIRFHPSVARSVAEVEWHRTQHATHEADGSLLFRVSVSGYEELVGWILAYGEHAEVLEPPELRRRIHEEIKRLAARYESPVRAGSATAWSNAGT